MNDELMINKITMGKYPKDNNTYKIRNSNNNNNNDNNNTYWSAIYF